MNPNGPARPHCHSPGGNPPMYAYQYEYLIRSMSALRAPGLLVFPRNPNALPVNLYKQRSLIDFDYWAAVNDTLRQKGAVLPYDFAVICSTPGHQRCKSLKQKKGTNITTVVLKNQAKIGTHPLSSDTPMKNAKQVSAESRVEQSKSVEIFGVTSHEEPLQTLFETDLETATNCTEYEKGQNAACLMPADMPGERVLNWVEIFDNLSSITWQTGTQVWVGSFVVVCMRCLRGTCQGRHPYPRTIEVTTHGSEGAPSSDNRVHWMQWSHSVSIHSGMSQLDPLIWNLPTCR
ncbi:uncharacterized protein EI97DRAFT_478418 [Westerdykella ornata]|uniref:Uncharacterized protein n=1 Tax=Westerdykella ornata TaxID=318751 RepID=A0A6A6JXA0_WESOR|nr:uncharacterized protein EI97DRAFT_478418 [Westerdykella ornata]KAF2280448.1 hypothetical protein EI97DRAFT_478418 [Westerdykella ornata]